MIPPGLPPRVSRPLTGRRPAGDQRRSQCNVRRWSSHRCKTIGTMRQPRLPGRLREQDGRSEGADPRLDHECPDHPEQRLLSDRNARSPRGAADHALNGLASRRTHDRSLDVHNGPPVARTSAGVGLEMGQAIGPRGAGHRAAREGPRLSVPTKERMPSDVDFTGVGAIPSTHRLHSIDPGARQRSTSKRRRCAPWSILASACPARMQ